MKQIIGTPDGKPYLGVEVNDEVLRLVLLQYAPDWTISVDKKVIPDLIKVLQKSLEEK